MSDPPVSPPPSTFDELVASRQAWIQTVLKPWAQVARRVDLCLAEQEWTNLAGKVDPTKTLWAWAWGRFPELVHADLGIDETKAVIVRLHDGRTIHGYPDARDSQQGRLVLIGPQGEACAPVSIDDVEEVLSAE
jgi:hypothetical protein